MGEAMSLYSPCAEEKRSNGRIAEIQVFVWQDLQDGSRQRRETVHLQGMRPDIADTACWGQR